MKHCIRTITLSMVVTLVAFGAFAQSSATDTATANAEIIQAITLVYDAANPLEFGLIAQPAAADTVTVTAAAAPTRTAANDGTILLAGTTITAAKFDMTGDPNRTFAVTLPADGTVTISNGATTMPVNGFSASCTGAGCALDGAGTFTLYVGGSLGVSASQATGAYTGTFDVTAAYN